MRFLKTAFLSLEDLKDIRLHNKLRKEGVEAVVIELQPFEDSYLEGVFRSAKALIEDLGFNNDNLVTVKIPNPRWLEGNESKIANATASGVKVTY